MSLDVPESLPLAGRLTQADVTGPVALRRDVEGQPYLVVRWWPRLVRLDLSTRTRPVKPGSGWSWPVGIVQGLGWVSVVSQLTGAGARLAEVASVHAWGATAFLVVPLVLGALPLAVVALALVESVVLDTARTRLSASRPGARATERLSLERVPH